MSQDTPRGTESFSRPWIEFQQKEMKENKDEATTKLGRIEWRI
jgi:hypothetical protein